VAEWLQTTFDMTGVQANLVLSVALVVVLLGIWWVVVRAITSRVEDSSVWYAARKVTSYVVALSIVFGLLLLWVGALRDVGTFLGLFAAGIAIALADVLKNFVGWLFIMLRRPWRVDDRIEVDGVAGDVIDVRMFRTTLLEIGNWVDADQSTGRIVHVPNGKVFAAHVYNSTEGFGYIWHEVVLRVTFESDWQRAEQLMLEALKGAAGHTVEEAAHRIRRASQAYKIRYTHLTPTTYITVKDSGVTLTGRILVDARRRRAVDQQVWRALLLAIASEPAVEIAYPTQRTFLRDPLRIEHPDGQAGVPTERHEGGASHAEPG
jgi:small-conductance mechanosensitive channel